MDTRTTDNCPWRKAELPQLPAWARVIRAISRMIEMLFKWPLRLIMFPIGILMPLSAGLLLFLPTKFVDVRANLWVRLAFGCGAFVVLGLPTVLVYQGGMASLKHYAGYSQTVDEVAIDGTIIKVKTKKIGSFFKLVEDTAEFRRDNGSVTNLTLTHPEPAWTAGQALRLYYRDGDWHTSSGVARYPAIPLVMLILSLMFAIKGLLILSFRILAFAERRQFYQTLEWTAGNLNNLTWRFPRRHDSVFSVDEHTDRYFTIEKFNEQASNVLRGNMAPINLVNCVMARRPNVSSSGAYASAVRTILMRFAHHMSGPMDSKEANYWIGRKWTFSDGSLAGIKIV